MKNWQIPINCFDSGVLDFNTPINPKIEITTTSRKKRLCGFDEHSIVLRIAEAFNKEPIIAIAPQSIAAVG
jgi:hypothetical protein